LEGGNWKLEAGIWKNGTRNMRCENEIWNMKNGIWALRQMENEIRNM